MMFGSAIPDVFSNPVAVEGMHGNLGYPVYFIPFIGVAKVLGVIALLVPGYPKIREWAYAGLFFDLIGATYSIIASGGNAGQYGFMITPIANLYFFNRLRLPRIPKQRSLLDHDRHLCRHIFLPSCRSFFDHAQDLISLDL